MGTSIIAMTGNNNLTLALPSDIHLDISVEQEAFPHNLTPTSSTAATPVMGDALEITLLISRGLTPENFARSHLSSALRRRLFALVSTIMKSGKDAPIVTLELLLIDTQMVMSKKAFGIVLITDSDNTLLGIFTDGDLRRVLEKKTDIRQLLVGEVMTKKFKFITPDKPAIVALEMMDKYNLNSLPVFSAEKEVVGAINMHTLMQAKIV